MSDKLAPPDPVSMPAPAGRWRWPLVAGVAVVLVTCAVAAVAAQDTLCAGSLRATCRSWGVGHVPTEQEDTMWSNIRSPNDCAALRRFQTRFPESPYGPKLAERLGAMKEEERWFNPTKLPSVVVVLAREGGVPTEAEARAAAEARAVVEAKRVCEGIPNTRLESSSARADKVECGETNGGWACAWEGWADCVGARRSVKEVCP